MVENVVFSFVDKQVYMSLACSRSTSSSACNNLMKAYDVYYIFEVFVSKYLLNTGEICQSQ